MGNIKAETYTLISRYLTGLTLEQKLANYGLWDKAGPTSGNFVIRALLEHNYPHSFIAYRLFHATGAELGRCNKGHMYEGF